MSRRAIVTAVALVVGTQSAGATCNNGTMTGTWGYHYTSVDFNSSTFCSGVGAMKFSSPNHAQVIGGKVSCNGGLVSSFGSGTYSMASSCLGRVTLIANTGATLNYYLSVTNGGKEVDFVLGLDGVTLSGSGKKQ